MVRFFKKKTKNSLPTEDESDPANVPSTSSLKARVEEVKIRRSKSKKSTVDVVGTGHTGTTQVLSIIRQVIIGVLAGSIIGISVIGLGKFSAISILVILAVLYIVNQCGYIQINWNRVEEDEKILEEGITGEAERKVKRTLTQKVIDETTHLLSSNEEREEDQKCKLFHRFFERTFPFIASLLVGIAIGLVIGIVLFSKK